MVTTFSLTPDELTQWKRDGFVVRENVFSPEENDALRQVAEDVVAGRRQMPTPHIDRNARVDDGKVQRDGIYAMHKIHHPSCYMPEFLERVRDPRLTDPSSRLAWAGYCRHQQSFYLESAQDRSGFPLASGQVLLW